MRPTGYGDRDRAQDSCSDGSANDRPPLSSVHSRPAGRREKRRHAARLRQALELEATRSSAKLTPKDTIPYALGLGLGADPMDERQLRFVYEKDLLALPTIATVLARLLSG